MLVVVGGGSPTLCVRSMAGRLGSVWCWPVWRVVLLCFCVSCVVVVSVLMLVWVWCGSLVYPARVLVRARVCVLCVVGGVFGCWRLVFEGLWRVLAEGSEGSFLPFLAGDCCWWRGVVPRQSWLRAVAAVSRRSWLRSAASDGGRFLSNPG